MNRVDLKVYCVVLIVTKMCLDGVVSGGVVFVFCFVIMVLKFWQCVDC